MTPASKPAAVYTQNAPVSFIPLSRFRFEMCNVDVSIWDELMRSTLYSPNLVLWVQGTRGGHWSKVWREIRTITVELTRQPNQAEHHGNDKDLQNVKRLKPWIHFQIFTQEQELEDGGSLKVSFHFNGEPSPGFLFIIMIFTGQVVGLALAYGLHLFHGTRNHVGYACDRFHKVYNEMLTFFWLEDYSTTIFKKTIVKIV